MLQYRMLSLFHFCSERKCQHHNENTGASHRHFVMNTVIISHHARALYNTRYLRKDKILFRYVLTANARLQILITGYGQYEGHYGQPLYHIMLNN
jgi:hypothetical protein